MSTTGAPTATNGRAGLMLGLATLGFALNFWAWALLSPLAVSFTAALHLTPFQQSLLVAVPVVVGSLGRIPVGALTDRFGGRVMFPIISLVTVVPVLYLGLFGHSSLAALLVGGFFLGIAGTAFAVGVPFVSAWFPPERRGFAVGVFGAGMGGTAISALTTVKLVNAHSTQHAVRDHRRRADRVRRGRRAGAARRPWAGRPHRVARPPAERGSSAADHLAGGSALRDRLRWLRRLQRLPAHLPEERLRPHPCGRLEPDGRLRGRRGPDAAGRRLALGPGTRRIGADGRLRRGRRRCLDPVDDAGPRPVGTIVFLSMAGALGAASGATFALVAQRAPAAKVGSVTGIVGAAGGLGGFIPPLVMGSIFGHSGDYGTGLLALSAMAVLVLLLALSIRRTPTPHAA